MKRIDTHGYKYFGILTTDQMKDGDGKRRQFNSMKEDQNHF